MNKFLKIDLRVLLILTSIAMYALYLQRQYIDIFFESQFLHIKFLENLTAGKFSAKGFFTVYGEHLFPGYNLILAVNYYTFKIWGGFDALVYFVSLIGSLLVFSKVIVNLQFVSITKQNVAIGFAALTLISTTNNPQWGMALSAAVGVTIVLLCLYQLDLFLNGARDSISKLTFLCIPATIILFLGGYAIGFIAAVSSIVLVSSFYSKLNLYKSKYIVLIVVISVLIYAAIVINYGSLVANRPKGDSFEVLMSVKFFLIMMGSSLLGRATFEGLHSLAPYYICGILLAYWTLIAYINYVRRPTKGSMFLIALLTYSLTNILAVSLFRYKNGLEGGMGQWYNVHTHFIAPIIFVFILSTLDKNDKVLSKIAKYVSIFLLLLAGSLGYFADFRKAPHTKVWKQQFVDQTYTILTSPEEIVEKNNSFNTMLWNFPEVKAGVDFLYKNSLWMFKNKSPTVHGLASDSWHTADKKTLITCPGGTTAISFDSWRPETWAQSKVRISTSNSISLVDVVNGASLVSVNPENAFLKIESIDGSNPISSSEDPRHLVFIIKNILCIAAAGSKVKLPNLRVNNWGPTSALKNEVPNPQPDGGIGIWIAISSDSQGLIDDGIDIFIGETSAHSVSIQKDLITASFDPKITIKSGEYRLYIRNKATGEKAQIGTFEVN